MPPVLPQSQNQIETRILTAAAHVFGHYGYDKSTLGDIAREAGVAKSTLYLRWKTKEDLFGAVLWHQARQFTYDWLARVAEDPAGGTFANLYRHGVLLMRENAFVMALITRDRNVLGGFLKRPEMDGFVEERFSMSRLFLMRLQAAGVIRHDLNIEAVGFLLNSMQYGFLRLDEITQEEPPIEDALDILAEMLDRLLTPEDGGDSEAGKQVIAGIMAEIHGFLDAFESRPKPPQ